MSNLEIQPVTAPPQAGVRPPGSKSLTNRALVCAALAAGQSRLTGVLDSEDTRVMLDALAALGIEVGREGDTAEVVGCGGKLPARTADLYIANSGTSVRFLTALAALGHGTYRLHGTPRMHERPIQDLLDALATLGVRAESESGSGCPPVVVHADGLPAGKATIRGDVSSQFLSGVLLAAPCASGVLEIDIDGRLVSKPYVEMTLAVMRAFGAQITVAGDARRFTIEPAGYRGTSYAIEPDASAASYFWAAAAITGGRVRVEGLGSASLQGDVAFCDCLRQMGCRVDEDPAGTTVEGGRLAGIDVDMNAISDTVQTLAAVALFAEGPTNIRHVEHIRHKETDRIAALACELRKFGANVEERSDGLRIVPGSLHGATIDTYDDHRMAMSLALVGLKIPGVVINDPGCTAKTYPDFWQDLERLRVAP
ncbi:MAG: 3-phosphoshikimate 1-carboxyvinyltransferase [Planctomycetota bacterium]|nr:MAG: 3-phosphoshikimate 1-carboxyvinyltransferase [Planctomycetota bacterium]